MSIKLNENASKGDLSSTIKSNKSSISVKDQTINYESMLQQMENESREHIGVFLYHFYVFRLNNN